MRKHFWKKVKSHLFWRFRRTGILNKLSDENYLKLAYWVRLNKVLNLKNPQKFNEKMQWLKLYNRRPEHTEMVDKYLAKEYVAKTIGEKYIIPTLGVWERYIDIDFDKLPEKFVLKTTHNSGGIAICQNRNTFDFSKAKKILEESLKHNYFYGSREWPYKGVQPRIIAEEYLENDADGLHDYKVWCFNGEPVYIQYITGRIGNITYEGFYDLKWMLQDFSYHNARMKEPIEKPVCLEELIDLARTLAKNQPFARCDFYVLEDGSIRFGEITFYPMSGMEKWKPEKMDEELGRLIDINFGM